MYLDNQSANYDKLDIRDKLMALSPFLAFGMSLLEK